MPHNIVFATASDADDTAFGIGDTWQVKFTQAGTYQYQCTLHPGMTGTVTVQ
jgi:plastocyanin